jgi:hypothetical protein
MTDSMKRAIDETTRRRNTQVAITSQQHQPQSIIKPIDMNLVAIAEGDYVTVARGDRPEISVPPEQMDQYPAEMEEKMREAARKFDFKQAAASRPRRNCAPASCSTGRPSATCPPWHERPPVLIATSSRSSASSAMRSNVADQGRPSGRRP